MSFALFLFTNPLFVFDILNGFRDVLRASNSAIRSDYLGSHGEELLLLPARVF